MSILIRGIDLPEAYTSAWLTVFECVGEHTFIKTHKVSAEQMQAIPPHGRWVPVSERLPEEDTEVLISYRYKEGEGDTSHVNIDITTYGQMYFGGNKVGNNKHWRAPFEYFHSNYEVIAWMPLPEPYKEEAETADEP